MNALILAKPDSQVWDLLGISLASAARTTDEETRRDSRGPSALCDAVKRGSQSRKAESLEVWLL
jgi:hypothetical protein